MVGEHGGQMAGVMLRWLFSCRKGGRHHSHSPGEPIIGACLERPADKLDSLPPTAFVGHCRNVRVDGVKARLVNSP
jgi:hypothetical protein